MFPPGRARLATNPLPTEIAVMRHDDRESSLIAFLAAGAASVPDVTITSTVETH